MPKRKKSKKSVESLIAEIVRDKLEVELHKQLRKARGNVARQRKKTENQVIEVKALPLPDVIDAEIVEEGQLSFLPKEEAQETNEIHDDCDEIDELDDSEETMEQSRD